jgi:3-dehydroquinate synthase II
MKFYWVDCTAGGSWEDRKALITAALESGAEAVVVEEEDLEKAEKLGNLILATFGNAGELAIVGCPGEGDGTEDLPRSLQESTDLRKIKDLKKKKKITAAYVEIAGKKYERLAALEARDADYIIVVGKDWKVIPLENLIAELHREDVKVMAGVRDAEEAKLALETLELGVDGVLLSSPDVNEVKKVSELVVVKAERLKLISARVIALKQVGMGDRVCVDAASLLEKGEGMLVGSQGSGLFLVHSETLESEYVASRPFRVNAGAVHAYIMAPEGKTRYLSELEAGDEVLAVNSSGNTRSVVVGRVKIERRPLILIEAEHEGRVYKTLLQNAETINLLRKDGSPVSVTQLKVGDEVLLYAKTTGRHFGMEVEESVIER